MSDVYDERSGIKKRHQLYRDVAKKLFPSITFRDQVTVNEVEGGAIIEGNVFVPAHEIKPNISEWTASCTEDGFDKWWYDFGLRLSVQDLPVYYIALGAWAASRARVESLPVKLHIDGKTHLLMASTDTIANERVTDVIKKDWR